MLTKKYYKAIARVIKYEGREFNNLSYITGFSFEEGRNAVKRITLSLAIIFSEDNPQFNKELFLEACKGD